MSFKHNLAQLASEILTPLVPGGVRPENVLINLTDAHFTGHYTLVLFPFIKSTGKNPQELGQWLGTELQQRVDYIQGFELVKGFLNLEIKAGAWKESMSLLAKKIQEKPEEKGAIVIEFPSPNTNKPLHLGHLRNIFLGTSLSRILEENGFRVIPVCLYNDRGTNISKSMLMYMEAKQKLTPENSGIKPDKLVGDYYVSYNDALKKEIAKIQTEQNISSAEEAKKLSELEKKVAELTVQWENENPEVRDLWKMMNGWFYAGVEKTYEKLDVKFEKTYYESDVYNLGKETVAEGLEKGIFYKKEDGSVAIDLTDVGLDEKVVLRSNGTSVYITQDMALAYQKQKEFTFEKSIYVVGNEQDYHFKVLIEILKRLGLKASDNLYHLSYGMVELPTGKMKTREGTVVEADELLEEVIEVAREKANEQGKLSEVTDAEKEKVYREIGIGGLRYFILKVDPKKRIIFIPEESIDFNGNTASFIQYMYARTRSILRNAKTMGWNENAANPYDSYIPTVQETQLLRNIAEYPEVIRQAGEEYSPALIANYVYQLAAGYSSYYHDHKILKEADEATRNFRISLTALTGDIIRKSLYLLGIECPERM